MTGPFYDRSVLLLKSCTRPLLVNSRGGSGEAASAQTLTSFSFKAAGGGGLNCNAGRDEGFAKTVAIFAFSPMINWAAVVALGIGGVLGGITGSWLMHRLPERLLRGFVVLVGLSLTIWLFVR